MQSIIGPHLRIVSLLLVAAVADQSSLSLKDTVGSEIISRVDVQRDALGDLGDASSDVDAPEQLELPTPPKPKALTPSELALVQSKTSHKEVANKQTMLRGKMVQAQKKQEPAKEAPQAALTKAWEKSSKQEAKAADADVEQLGGQLNNIMSELNAPVSGKETANGKKALEQATAMEDAADSGDEAAAEKEAAKAGLGDSQKDDSENVVDGAMAYIRTRLAAEEHKSMRLRQLLSQSVRGNKNMRERIEQLRKELTESAALQKSLRTAAAKKVAEEEAEITKQTKRGDAVTKMLQNATRAAKIGEKGMKVLGMRLKYAKSQVAALLLNLANSSQQNKDLSRKLEITNATAVKEADELAKARKEAADEKKELEETKAKLAKLTAVKKVEDAAFKQLDRQKDWLEQRQASAAKRDAILHKENHLLKKQLASEIQREEQLREMWSKESEAFTWQLRAERANATESLSDLEKARSQFRDLRQRVEKLRAKASKGEDARHRAEDSVNRAQFALAEAEAENKQLKGSVPWLEAEVDRQRAAAANATKEKQQVMKERDTVKAVLAEAQKNIVQLQGQYADALQALVVAQAGGSDASKQQAPSTIQQFASSDSGPGVLGAPPPVSSPVGFPQVEGASSLLELRRDSKALNKIMSRTQDSVSHERDNDKVDLSKESGGLSALLQGMNAAH